MSGRSYGDPSGNETTFVTPGTDGSLADAFYRKENQLASPSQTWCLIDEDAGSINDSLFLVDMSAANGIPDMPSSRHGQSYEISFADGHMENVKMLHPASDWVGSAVPDPDWVKLKSWTTVPR